MKNVSKPGQAMGFDVAQFKQVYLSSPASLNRTEPAFPTLRSRLDDISPVIDRLETYAGGLRVIRDNVIGPQPEQGAEPPISKPVTIMDVIVDLHSRLIAVTDVIERLTRDLHDHIG